MEASALERTGRRTSAYSENRLWRPIMTRPFPTARHGSSTPLGVAETKAVNARGGSQGAATRAWRRRPRGLRLAAR